MHKISSFISMLIIVALMTLAATAAFAFKTGGEFAGDKFGGTDRYSTDIAPTSAVVYLLGTKGYTNLDLTDKTQYKFFFSKVSDNTAVTGKIKFGGYAPGATGYFTSTGEKFTVGKGLKSVGFAAYSSATPVQVTVIY